MTGLTNPDLTRAGEPGQPLAAPTRRTNGHGPDMHWPSLIIRTPANGEPQPERHTVTNHGDDKSTGATIRAVGPLALVNGLAVYGQLAYAHEHIAPTGWPDLARIGLAVAFAAACESVALYVGWHAHDALLLKAHSTARRLRRASYLIAAVFGLMNYAHFAGPGMAPTAAAGAFGLLSLLSPWLWGLHTRRSQRLQLLRERRADEAGAEFSAERRRNFPIRTFLARRWSIDHGVTDPLEAWRGYNADRAAARAAKVQTDRLTDRRADNSVGRRPTAGPTVWSVARPTDGATIRSVSRRTRTRPADRLPDRPTTRLVRRPVADRPVGPVVGHGPTDRPTTEPTGRPTGTPTDGPTSRSVETGAYLQVNNGARPTTDKPRRASRKIVHSPAAVANAATLRETYPRRLTDSDSAIRKATGWSYDRFVAAKAAYLAGADKKTDNPTDKEST